MHVFIPVNILKQQKIIIIPSLEIMKHISDTDRDYVAMGKKKLNEISCAVAMFFCLVWFFWAFAQNVESVCIG